MTPELKTLLASAEGKKRELITRIESMTEGARQQARPGAWSPQQVIDHIVSFEEQMLVWADGATGKERPGLKGAFFATVLSGMMYSAVPMPTLPQFEVGTPAALPDLLTRWNAVRILLAARLDAHATEPSAPFLLHPIAGPLTARQALTLLDSHLTYHLHRPPLKVVAGNT